MFLNSHLLLLKSKVSGTETERKVVELLLDRDTPISATSLHNIAALTWNDQECRTIYNLVSKSIKSNENEWWTIDRALVLLKHLIVFGAERSVDYAWNMERDIISLRTYNSALVGLIINGGTDFGQPVRNKSAEIVDLLQNEDKLRQARTKAQEEKLSSGAYSSHETNTDQRNQFGFTSQETNKSAKKFGGDIIQQSIGASFSLGNVPGMYENRPERYFDNQNDSRRGGHIQDAQHTRDMLAPNLLDLDFGNSSEQKNIWDSVPEIQDLSQIQKQHELEEKLKQKQAEAEWLRQQLTQQQSITSNVLGSNSLGFPSQQPLLNQTSTPQQLPIGQLPQPQSQQFSMNQFPQFPTNQSSQPSLNQSQQFPFGQANQFSLGQSQQLPMSQSQSSLNQSQPFPLGQGNQFSLGQSQQLPLGQSQLSMNQSQQLPTNQSQQQLLLLQQQLLQLQQQQFQPTSLTPNANNMTSSFPVANQTSHPFPSNTYPSNLF